MVRVFVNDPEDRGSILGRVISMIQKMTRDASILNTQHYKVRIKGKWSNQEKGVAPSSTPQCFSDWKRSLRVALYYGRTAYIYVKRWSKRIR